MGLSDVFTLLDLSLRFGKNTTEMMFLSHYVVSGDTWYLHGLSQVIKSSGSYCFKFLLLSLVCLHKYDSCSCFFFCNLLFHIFCSFSFGNPVIFWLINRQFCFTTEISPLLLLGTANTFHLSVYSQKFLLARQLVFYVIMFFYFSFGTRF